MRLTEMTWEVVEGRPTGRRSCRGRMRQRDGLRRASVARSAQDLSGRDVAAAGWPAIEGAVGLWLWTKPLQKRQGSVSLWRSEADLQAFVETPPHVRIMNANRNRGRLTSHSLAGSDLSRRGAWRRASSVPLNTQAPM